MTAVSFTTIAHPNPGGVLSVEIPERVVKELAAGKRVPVRVTLNGDWVTSAKRAETRAARIPKVVAQVRAKTRAASTR
jgi:antitoxin component of MazEF toxin-antitoxin module